MLLLLLLLLLLQVVTDTPWSPAAAAPHPLYNLHRYLGVVAIAFTLLQVNVRCYLCGASAVILTCILLITSGGVAVRLSLL
jgi:hypothetical protein